MEGQVKQQVQEAAPGQGGVAEDAGRQLKMMRQQLLEQSDMEKQNIMSYEGRQVIGTGNEEGDCSVFNYHNNMTVLKLQSIRRVLRQIDEAIARLEDGLYGICARCHTEINPRRLTSIPFAIFCTACQSQIDRM